METFSKTAVFSLLSICFALVLLVLIVLDLMRPQLSRLPPEPQNNRGVQSNWLPTHTFNLLGGESPRPEGIDPERNSFQRAAPTFGAGTPESAETVPETPPDPPAPATREISLVYRGLYRSSGGEPFVYLEVEDVTRVYAMGDAVAAGWVLSNANVKEIILQQEGGTRMQFPFNRKKSLEVPIE
jgi:hypothetical protein